MTWMLREGRANGVETGIGAFVQRRIRVGLIQHYSFSSVISHNDLGIFSLLAYEEGW